MKKLLTIISAVLVTTISFAQTSSGTWNNATATYTNTNHGITWKLIDELNWVGRPILTGSTLFKVRNDDTHILIKLAASKYNGSNGDDIWNFISSYDTKEYHDMVEAVAKKDGMTLKSVTAIKSQLCGIHANKVKTDMTKYHSDHNVTVHCVEYTYQLCKNGYIYTIAVTGLSVLEEELPPFERIANRLINGFSIK